MGRRIRPKTRPRPASNDESQPGRIKIRMRRESSDTLEQMINAARKEAAKEANFKGFKSGKKVGIKAQEKKTEQVTKDMAALRETLNRRDTDALALSTRLRIVEKALSSIVHTVKDNNFDTRLLLNLNSAGVRMMSSDEFGMLATNKWKFVWGDAVVRDEDGVDRTMSTMQRHRLHPGHRIPIREMWPIWNAVSVNERPDIDPIQGMRGAWYWNARRYSTHSSAMNAWRRHMHNKQEAQTISTPEMVSRDVDSPHQLDYVVEEEDAAYVDEDTPEYREIAGADAERRTRNMRNRINGFMRSCELESCGYWTRHYTNNQNVIDSESFGDLNAFNRVCSNFAVPLYDWDEDNWEGFRANVNYFLEVRQHSGWIAAGEPRRRRRARRAVVRQGYNRDNY